jgi:hypothetical protein
VLSTCEIVAQPCQQWLSLDMAVSCENANCRSVTVRDLTQLSQKSSRIQRFYNYFKFFQNHYPPEVLWLHCIHSHLLQACVSSLQSSANGASIHRSLPPGPLRSIGDCFTWSLKLARDYFFASDLDLWPGTPCFIFFRILEQRQYQGTRGALRKYIHQITKT